MVGPDSAPEDLRERDHRWLRNHLIAYACIAALSLALNVATFAGELWAIWPVLGFGLLAGAHYLYVRSVYVDEAWVDERADDLRMKSYDFDHIRDIQRRHEERFYEARPGSRVGTDDDRPPS